LKHSGTVISGPEIVGGGRLRQDRSIDRTFLGKPRLRGGLGLAMVLAEKIEHFRPPSLGASSEPQAATQVSPYPRDHSGKRKSTDPQEDR